VDHAGDGGGTVTSDPAGIDCGSDCTEDYAESTIVTLTATAGALSIFTGWSGECTGTGACVVTMDAAKSVTATFDTATLTVTKVGTGSGTVVSDVAGINCGIDCSESYVPGTSVTLTATASGGGTFAGWSGACTGNGSCGLTVDADKTATAAFISPGSAEKIVYECVGDICVINADGTGYTNLTNSMGTQDIDPVWSPDGARIAFSSNQPAVNNMDRNYEIFVMNADGTNAVQQTFTTQGSGQTVQSYAPTWGPGGTEIAFEGWRTTQTGASYAQIVKIPVDGSGSEVVLTSTTDFAYKFQPDWSPDGTKILYTWDLGQQDVHVMNPDGSNPVSLTPDTPGSDQRDPVWSPDNTRFAFTDTRFWAFPHFNTEIFVRNADGSGEVQVTDHDAIDDTPSWSPDGSEIAFSSSRGGKFEIWSIAAPAPVGIMSAEAEAPATKITNSPGSGTAVDPDWKGTGGGGSSFAVTVTKSGTGTGTVTSSPAGISCGTDCTETYTSGTMVTLSSSPAAGSTFAGWSGACTGTGSCVVTMSAARSVTATFNLSGGGPFTLSVTKGGTGTGTVKSSPGGIKCGGNCTQSYINGTVVTLTATSAAGSTFAGWSGACTGTSSCVVTMNAAKTVTATFSLSGGGGPFTLTVTKAGAGTGTVTSSPAGINAEPIALSLMPAAWWLP